MLFICEQASVNLANVECSWVVDSGASFHLNPKRECFSSYTTNDYGYARMGNDGESRIVGIGNVCLLTSIICQVNVEGCTTRSGYHIESDIDQTT